MLEGGNVVSIGLREVREWAEMHLCECEMCSDRFNFLKEFGFGDDDEIEQKETEEDRTLKEKIKKIWENFLAEEKRAKIIPLKRNKENENK